MRPTDQRLEERGDPFVLAIGKTRTEKVGVRSPVGIKCAAGAGTEKRYLTVVIAAKIGNQSHPTVKVECDGGTTAMEIAHAITLRGWHRSPEGISEEPFELGGNGLRVVRGPGMTSRRRTRLRGSPA